VLLDAGVHFGHQTKRWNPKMRPYIYGGATAFILSTSTRRPASPARLQLRAGDGPRGGHPPLIATKRQAQEIVQEEAGRSGSFYWVNRWLGGTLTNFRTIKQASIACANSSA